MPADSISFSACFGLRSMATPSFSSTSALPEADASDLLPCLATGMPEAAATMATAVEQLNVVRPPPVPQVSISSPSTLGEICSQFARIALAIEATSRIVGPFISKATRKPAIWTSVISPSPDAADDPEDVLFMELFANRQFSQSRSDHDSEAPLDHSENL